MAVRTNVLACGAVSVGRSFLISQPCARKAKVDPDSGEGIQETFPRFRIVNVWLT
jgi:hypothetical protein